MNWYLRKGEQVPTDTPIRKTFWRIIEKDETSFNDVLWQCYDDNAPSTYQPHMRELCWLNWELDGVSSQITEFTHAETGAAMNKMDFDIVLKPSGASSEVSCSIAGRKLGASNVNIEYQ